MNDIGKSISIVFWGHSHLDNCSTVVLVIMVSHIGIFILIICLPYSKNQLSQRQRLFYALLMLSVNLDD